LADLAEGDQSQDGLEAGVIGIEDLGEEGPEGDDRGVDTLARSDPSSVGGVPWRGFGEGGSEGESVLFLELLDLASGGLVYRGASTNSCKLIRSQPSTFLESAPVLSHCASI
jgi:hypothetical protein